MSTGSASTFSLTETETAAIRPLNPVQLVRTGQRANDQPGCVHANMDLFKWALRLWPLLPSERVADALELAVSCRMLVRRAPAGTPSRIGLCLVRPALLTRCV